MSSSLRMRQASEASDGGTLSSRPSSPEEHAVYPHRRRRHRPHAPTSRPSQVSFAHRGDAADSDATKDQNEGGSEKPADTEGHSHEQDHSRHHSLISQVVGWLHEERKRRTTRRVKFHRIASLKGLHPAHHQHDERHGTTADVADTGNESDASSGSVALDRLERILSQAPGLEKLGLGAPLRPRPGRGSSERSTRRLARTPKLHHASSSDTDYFGQEVFVPDCELILGDAKTLGQTAAVSSAERESAGGEVESSAETKEWRQFKDDIVRVTHTLGIKGWRRIPLDGGTDIGVERLSGALTNAVYVVSPPRMLKSESSQTDLATSNPIPKKPPPKLLLRIYGPQVEYLIDRECELRILRRLARKSIGPRVLGTFANGRFEEYFHARTLAPEDIRNSDTSKQIAKRMRELHDGIELLTEEREGGPAVWNNWDKWLQRTEEVVLWTDRQILSGCRKSKRGTMDAWKDRGLICGVEWPLFRQTVEMARKWLTRHYGGVENIEQQLVFSHNDTQYGNILRLEPSGESPLLLPANQHKRLVVIDFEYAAANTPGLEFANHFTEWCYDYRDPANPHILRTGRYPTPEEQRRFIQSYVEHVPWETPRSSAPPSVSQTPARSSSFVSSYMLDSRTPASQLVEEEVRHTKEVNEKVERLMREARLWRVANSAQWVAWGVVQAHVPEMKLDRPEEETMKKDGGAPSKDSTADMDAPPSTDDKEEQQQQQQQRKDAADGSAPTTTTTTTGEDDEEGGDDAGGFDYLGYAQERALFFWGDVIGLGIVSKDDLPPDLLAKVKTVNY